MKLLRLKITDPNGFRSLPAGFEIHFLRDRHYEKAFEFNPYLLAGSNGSGKSNVLEALAEIFFHLDCMYLSNKPADFDQNEDNPEGFDPAKSRIDGYELEYFILPDPEQFPLKPGTYAHVRIIKTVEDPPVVTWVNSDEGILKNPADVARLRPKELLPEYVVGYASGNNETLSLPFFKSRFLQYDAYAASLEAQEFVDPSPEASLVYLDEDYSQAILLTNLLMWEDPDNPELKKLLEPFEEYVQLSGLERFRLVIRLDQEWEEDGGEGTQIEYKHAPLLQNLDLVDPEGSRFVRSYLGKLKRCATSWTEEVSAGYEDGATFDHQTGEGVPEIEVRKLILDYWVNDATKRAFQVHFEHDPLKLFELFQLLLGLDLHRYDKGDKQRIYRSQNIFLSHDFSGRPFLEDRILWFKDFHIRKTGVKESIFTKSLSDGEHQFLHALGLCLLFKDTRSLFLLDEPETHFNPDWKAKFISSLRHCFSLEVAASNQSMREMLITTHSPYLISDSRSEFVYLFTKNQQTGFVEPVQRPDFQTFGTSVNKIGVRIFGMPQTIGAFAQARLDAFSRELEELQQREELTNLLNRVTAELGESVERVILINRILDKLEALG